MKNTIIFFITISIILFACTNSKKTSKSKSKILNYKSLTIKEKTKIENKDFQQNSEDCLCSFDRIGEIKSGNKRFDLIIAGKGWNPSSYSCSWSWGEFINNEFPPDSSIKDFRIHLVDLNKIGKKLDSTFLSTKLFNENLIATYSKTDIEEYMTCKFDPNKTGKYPKPKHWTEE